MGISFPRKISAVAISTGNFPADDDGRHVICKITYAALAEHFGFAGGAPAAAQRVFTENRAAIEEIAAQKYARGALAPDGAVVIEGADVAQYESGAAAGR